jgi:hypothetical protein
MNKIKVKNYTEVPENYTGIIEYPNGTKYWHKKGKLHREDGPAVEWTDGSKEWHIEGVWYKISQLQFLIRTSIYLGKKQNGNYNLDWLRFLTEEGLREYPIVPGMESYGPFIHSYAESSTKT